MADLNKESQKLAEQRRKAEEKLQGMALSFANDLGMRAPEDPRQTIHELQVHQIELEMQNDELRRVQLELDSTRARYFDLYDLAPVGYLTLSAQGFILEANLTAVDMLSTTRSALVKQPITRFILKEDQDIYHLHLRHLMETCEPHACEVRMVKKDGTVFWVHLMASTRKPLESPVQAGEEEPVSRVMLSDISQRKQIEEEKLKLETQLQKAQKLETIGILAGGVAHDFNNLLAAIVGNANLGSMAVESDSKVANYFNTIEKVALKAAGLTRQMLDYAGQGKGEMTGVDLDIVVKEVAQLHSVSIPPNVTFRYELAERLPFVKGDTTQLFQILMNLIANAIEAVELTKDGQVTIRTRSEVINEGAMKQDFWALPLNAGNYVSVEVEDTGVGMTPDVVPMIFDPFFSTKFTGRGLGLAAVIGILGNHGGSVCVRSNPQKGSSFKVFLPAIQGTREIPCEEDMPAWRADGLLLLVDDEKEVRSTARQLAERLGFSVIEAWSGLEAVELFRLQHRDIAMVLLDLTMPRMDGVETFRAMRGIDNSVPVVLSSGYDVKDAGQLIEGLAGFLKKPYRIAEFQSVAQKAMARNTAKV